MFSIRTASILLALALTTLAHATGTIQRLGSCTAPGSVCATGLACVGPAGRELCNVLMGVDGSCGQDPYWVCQAGLTCDNGKCRIAPIARGGSCNNPNDVCDTGLVCVGPDGDMRCNTPMPLGGRCGQDPYWVCVDGLNCVEGTCRNPPVGRGGSCDNPNDVCDTGLACVGPDGDMRCNTPMPLGGRCGQDPYWVCVDGLDCVNGICRMPAIAEGGSCRAEGSMCAEGLVCAGTRRRQRRCVRPIALGESCRRTRRSIVVCEEGLDCIGNVCSRVVGERESCLETGTICADNLVCAGSGTRMMCVRPMGLGDRCGQDPYWVCEENAECVNNVCTRPLIGEGGRCGAEGAECASGLVCAGLRIRRRARCVKPVQENGRCSVRALFSVCEEGLECIVGRCRRGREIGQGGSCLAAGSRCASGLVCAGTTSDKRCVEPMGEGERCGVEPFWVCGEGLECSNGYCAGENEEEEDDD